MAYHGILWLKTCTYFGEENLCTSQVGLIWLQINEMPTVLYRGMRFFQSCVPLYFETSWTYATKHLTIISDVKKPAAKLCETTMNLNWNILSYKFFIHIVRVFFRKYGIFAYIMTIIFLCQCLFTYYIVNISPTTHKFKSSSRNTSERHPSADFLHKVSISIFKKASKYYAESYILLYNIFYQQNIWFCYLIFNSDP